MEMNQEPIIANLRNHYQVDWMTACFPILTTCFFSLENEAGAGR